MDTWPGPGVTKEYTFIFPGTDEYSGIYFSLKLYFSISSSVNRGILCNYIKETHYVNSLDM
jgi:hypothetical protein